MKKIIAYIILTLTLQSCIFTKGHFSEDGSMWVWNEKPNTNQHRPLLIEKSNIWIKKADNIKNLKSINIDVLGKKISHFHINEKGYSFGGTWQKNKTTDKDNNFEKISSELAITKSDTEKLLREFVDLGLNTYNKEEGYVVFDTENWLNFDKGYIYFKKENNRIKENDSIDLRPLTNNNYRTGLFEKIIITKKFDNNWFEWYRPTLGLQFTDTISLNKLPNIGQVLDINLTKYSKRILIFDDRKLDFLQIKVDNLNYGIAWDENSFLRYIITQDKNFKTPEKIEIGMSLSQISFSKPIVQNDEMFYSIKLKSDWNLAFCEKELKYFPTINKYNGDNCTSDSIKMTDKIKWIYKN